MSGAVTLHASCVATKNQAVLIVGPSRSGKSSLALQLIAFGCDLVSDDLVEIYDAGKFPIARSPRPELTYIEARGVGVLRAKTIPAAEVAFVVDMGHVEEARVPPERHHTLLRYDLPLLRRVEGIHFAASVFQLLREGRAM